MTWTSVCVYRAIRTQAHQGHQSWFGKQIMKSSRNYGCSNQAFDTVVFLKISKQHSSACVNTLTLHWLQNGKQRQGRCEKHTEECRCAEEMELFGHQTVAGTPHLVGNVVINYRKPRTLLWMLSPNILPPHGHSGQTSPLCTAGSPRSTGHHKSQVWRHRGASYI